MARKPPPPCRVTVRLADGRLWEELPEEERRERAIRMWESWVQMVGLPYLRQRAAREAARQAAGD